MKISYDPSANELVARGFAWTGGQGSDCRFALREADAPPLSAQALAAGGSDQERVPYGTYERRLRLAGQRYGRFHRRRVQADWAYFDAQGRLIPDTYAHSQPLMCVRYSLRCEVLRAPLRDGFEHISLRIGLNEDMAAGDLVVCIEGRDHPLPMAVKRGTRWLPGFEVRAGERVSVRACEALRDCCEAAGR